MAERTELVTARFNVSIAKNKLARTEAKVLDLMDELDAAKERLAALEAGE